MQEIKPKQKPGRPKMNAPRVQITRSVPAEMVETIDQIILEMKQTLNNKTKNHDKRKNIHRHI